MKKVILGISFFASLQVFACDIIVTDSSSLKNIAMNAQPGQEICVDGFGGKTYELDNIHFSAKGTENAPIIFKGLDSVHLLGINSQEGRANFYVSGQWLEIRNFEVSNFENGVYLRRVNGQVPHHTKIIDIKSHHNRYSGICIEGDYRVNGKENPDFHTYTNDQKPHDNTIKNCDGSYSEEPQHGDGINIRNGVGTGNIIIGCRTFKNNDDGIDLWEAGNQVKIINSWSFKNGLNGDGTGFKLGKAIRLEEDGTTYDGTHILEHCMAWDNKEFGFLDNGGVKSRELYNCTAYRNASAGFEFINSNNTFINNISYLNGKSNYLGANPYQSNNSWQINHIFSQYEQNIAEGTRGSTDRLPNTKWLKFQDLNYPNIGYWRR